VKLIIVPILAMVCIAGLEAYALHLGIDGALMGLAFASIGGLGGYEIKVIRQHMKTKK